MNVKQITTLERQNNIQKQVERLKDLEPQLWMRCKDAPLVRLEAKYHQKCMVLFMKRQTEKVWYIRKKIIIYHCYLNIPQQWY